HAPPEKAARRWRDGSGPQRHQVHRRALRPARRRAGWRGGGDGTGACPGDQARHHAWPVRGLAGAPGPAHAAAADRSAGRQCGGPGGGPGPDAGSRTRALPGAGSHARLRRRRRPSGSPALPGPAADGSLRRQPGWRGDDRLALGHDLAPLPHTRGAGAHRHERRHDPGFGRNRGPGRHRGRLRTGAELMAVYTIVQLLEVLLFAAVLLVGVLSLHPSVVFLGGGLLLGKATMNILAPEGGSIYRRSLVGYAVGLIYFAVGLLLVHALP